MRRQELLARTTIALVLAFGWSAHGFAEGGAAAHDLSVTVASDGRVHIDPATTRLALRANAPWELHAQFVPATPGDDLALHASLDGVSWVPLEGGVCLTRGGPTAGWAGLTVAYAVDAIPSDGIHHGSVEYTLAYP